MRRPAGLLAALTLALLAGGALAAEPPREAKRSGTAALGISSAPDGSTLPPSAEAGPRAGAPDENTIWKGGITAGIAASEYDIAFRESDNASLESPWGAVNRAQELRIDFMGRGIRVRPRGQDPGARGEWSLTPRALEGPPPSEVLAAELAGKRADRDDAPQGFPDLDREPLVSGPRIEQAHDGMTEWYVNGPEGVQQGLRPIAAARCSRAGISEDARGESEAMLVLDLAGDVVPAPSRDGRAIELRGPHGSVTARYGDLTVVDGAGRTLGSRLEVFEESGARGIRLVFDVAGAVDPLTIRARITGASRPSTSAAPGGMTQPTPRPHPSDHAPSVGLLEHATAAPALAGATADWTVGSAQARAEMGFSVASAGDVNGDGFADVIVGADRFDNGQTDEGRAFVYLGSASGLATAPGWIAEANQARARFGAWVAPAGDVNRDGFDDVIVGAPGYSHPGFFADGAAFVYLGSAAGLAPTPVWGAQCGQDFADLGITVASAGDVDGDGYADVIVGADGYNTAAGADAGRALVYRGSPAGPSAAPSWIADGDQAFAYLGSVASAGDVNGDGFDDVLVGVFLEDDPEPDEGRVLVYEGSASGLAATPAWSARGGVAGAQLGLAVAPAGDVDGDGFSDVIVGAFGYDGAFPGCGRALVYQGSASGLSSIPAWTAQGDQAGAAFGISVAGLGDENHDGFDDVVVGAEWEDAGQTDEGRLSVFRGSASGLRSFASWSAESDQAFAYFGFSVAGAGDVNGDGFADIIAGAFAFDRAQTDDGSAFLYLGPKQAPDGDGDGAPDDADCAPLDGTVFAIPGQIHRLAFLTADTLRWDSDATGSGTGTRYDVMSGAIGQFPVGSGTAERCLVPVSVDTTTQDALLPVPGTGFYYLVRGRNLCGAGSWGSRSDGSERTTAVCP